MSNQHDRSLERPKCCAKNGFSFCQYVPILKNNVIIVNNERAAHKYQAKGSDEYLDKTALSVQKYT